MSTAAAGTRTIARPASSKRDVMDAPSRLASSRVSASMAREEGRPGAPEARSLEADE